MFGRRKKHRDTKQLRLINDKAPFAFVEAYKALRTNIEFLASTNNYRSIMVTSSLAADGKSTVTMNLATVMADSGKKVILVDCDLRKGTIASYLKVSRRIPGITNVLSGQEELSEVILHNDALKVDFLPTGPLPANPSEIIGSTAMSNLLQKLAETYDYVFIDTPPVSVVTDAAVLSRYVDGVILVARADATTKQALNSSKKNLEDVNAHLLGVVLNDFDVKKHSYGRGYYYSYYYSSYGNDVEKKRAKVRKRR